MHPPWVNRADAVAHALLQRRQLVLDAGFGLEPGKLLAERRLAAEIIDLGLALDLVERALDLLEAGEGVGDALVIELAAQLDPAGRRFVPGDDGALARLGVGELGLQLADILVLLGEGVGDLGDLALQVPEALGGARLGEERALGEVLAVLGEGELGAALPVVVLAAQGFQPPLALLLLGDRAHGARAHLDQRVLHLLDDQPDDLLGVLRPVEDGVDVGIHDVGQPRENAHENAPSRNRCLTVLCSWRANACRRPAPPSTSFRNPLPHRGRGQGEGDAGHQLFEITRHISTALTPTLSRNAGEGG